MADEANSEKIHIKFTESKSIRTIHVDGVWGAIAPAGNIYMAVFNERQPLPEAVEHRLTPQGALGEEIGREYFHGITREIEAHLVFSTATAHLIRDWLDLRIQEAEKTTQESRQRRQE